MKRYTIVLGALAALALPAHGADLWNQESAFHTSGGAGFVDEEFSDFPTYSTYNVDDVIVGAGGWTVNQIQTEVIATNTTAVTGITQARLNLFTNNGTSLPAAGNDPTTGSVVTVAVTADTNFTNVFYVTASGLNLNLGAGEYWVGLSPLASFSSQGETYIGYTNPPQNPAGANYFSAAENPGGSFALAQGTGWGNYNGTNGYGAMDIQGTPAPEPASMAALGVGVLALIRRRRSRKA